MFNAPIIARWIPKKLSGMKETSRNWMGEPQYSIATVYKDLMGTSDKVQWARLV